MPSSKIDKQIAAVKRRIKDAEARGIDATGYESQLNKLMVKKQMRRAGL